MDTAHIAIDPFVTELRLLGERAAVEPSEPEIAAFDAHVRSLVARLYHQPSADESPAEGAPWLATRTSEAVMVIGRGMFLLAELPDGAVSLVSDAATWSFVHEDGVATVSFNCDDTYRSWRILADGTVEDRNDAALLLERLEEARNSAAQSAYADEQGRFAGAEAHARSETEARAERRVRDAPPPALPVPWRGTHRVGAHALPVGGVPEGTFAPGTVLDAGLPVRLLGTTTEGWALVECSNGWQCYVAAWGIEPAEGARSG